MRTPRADQRITRRDLICGFRCSVTHAPQRDEPRSPYLGFPFAWPPGKSHFTVAGELIVATRVSRLQAIHASPTQPHDGLDHFGLPICRRQGEVGRRSHVGHSKGRAHTASHPPERVAGRVAASARARMQQNQKMIWHSFREAAGPIIVVFSIGCRGSFFAFSSHLY